jgi:tetratricopeptide (TPR) repeat protein
VSEKELDRQKLASVRDPRRRFPLLNSIALASQRTEISYAIELLREALHLAEASENPVYIAQTNLNLARWLGYGGFFDDAMLHLKAARSLFEERNDTDALLDVELVNAMILLEEGEYEEAFLHADKVYQYRHNLRKTNVFTEPVLVSRNRVGSEPVGEETYPLNNELKLANATRVLATVEASRMNYYKALSYLDANFELWHHLGETQEAATALNNAAAVYAHMNEFPRAIEFFQRALTIYRLRDAQLNIATTLSNLANIQREMGDYDSAFVNLKEAWGILKQHSHPPFEVEVTLQFAKYYIGLEDYDEAYIWASRSLQIADSRILLSMRSEILAIVGKILFLLKRYEESLTILTEGLKVAEKSAHLETEVRCLQYLYLSLKELGRIDESFHYLERYQAAESQLLQQQLLTNSNAIKERFTAKFALTGDTLYHAENSNLATDIERLTQELSRLMRKVRKKDKMLDEIKKETAALVNYSKETQEILKPILSKVSQTSADEDSAMTENLQQMQMHFINILRQKYPALSKAELRICSLLNLDMSTNEMAALLKISVRTVENHRFHIRQKLGIGEDISIQEALRKALQAESLPSS